MKLRDLIPEKVYRPARNLWWKLQTRRIPFDRLLCGGENGMNGLQFAFHSEDFTRTSTPFIESPHVRFLRRYLEQGETTLLPGHFEVTDYYQNAAQCIRLFGRYFTATREEHIVQIARKFVADFLNVSATDRLLSPSPAYSNGKSLPEVLPLRYSDCFQVKDGNHRLAIAYLRGAKNCLVRVANSPQLTSLQQLLLAVSWNVNQRDLYQPIHSPELGADWRLVRRCTDRLTLMNGFLDKHPVSRKPCKSYLDVACNYGWFVKSMHDRGYDAYGLEVDKAARVIGQSFLGLNPERVHASEAIEFLGANCHTYDVISCFSLAHHFAMRSDNADLLTLIRGLDRATGQTLFFEMGDEGEAWFSEKLAGWNPLTIKKWLEANTTFNEIIPLGTDEDRIGPFKYNYHRTLFACVR